MDDAIVGVVWPTPENYARFRELFGSEDYPDTFMEFVQMAAAQLAQHGLSLAAVKKVFVEPDELWQWCMANHGKVDTDIRALYALGILRAKHGEGPEAIN